MLSFSFIFLLVVILQNVCVQSAVKVTAESEGSKKMTIEGLKDFADGKLTLLKDLDKLKIYDQYSAGGAWKIYVYSGPRLGPVMKKKRESRFKGPTGKTRKIKWSDLEEMIRRKHVMGMKEGQFKILEPASATLARFQDADYYNYGAARAQNGDYYYSGEYGAEEQGVSAYTDGFRRGYDYAMSRLLRDHRY